MQDGVEVKLGRTYYVTQFTGSKRRKVLKQDSFYYVPLLKTIKQLLENPVIRMHINNSPVAQENLISDISDGGFIKNHPFFQANPGALQIIAYYDEVETCNPLGSSSKKFKLGCLFFSIGNMKPSLRSSLKSIFLLSIAKSSTIKAHGIDSILEPFIKDIMVLSSEGVNLVFTGRDEVWKGTLVAFLADNLAAHEVGGFKESFSFARRFCRSCMTNLSTAKSYFNEAEFDLRSPSNHADQCRALQGSNSHEASVEYGINRQAALEKIPGFSVTLCLPHDVMHDLLEGVIPHEMKLLLQHCLISKRYFELLTFNQRLTAFDFGYTEVGDKPARVENNCNMRQSASQMWLLMRIFPLLVGDLIPREDSHWQCFLKLMCICDIATAPSISTDTVAYLELLIEEHHSEFCNLYGNDLIIPKMHFMVHYPRQMLQFGPLVHAWTMRYEAKLRVIKRATRMSNFKNVCQSAVKRHQHLLSYYIHANKLFSNQLEFGSSKSPSLLSSECAEVVGYLTTKQSLKLETFVSHPSFIKFNGVIFKVNAFILLAYDVFEPVFAKVHDLLVAESCAYIVCREFITQFYDVHYHAYVIKATNNPTSVHEVTSLPYLLVLHSRSSFDRSSSHLYVSLKTHIE